MSGLIWVQTVCKGNQQTTIVKVGVVFWKCEFSFGVLQIEGLLDDEDFKMKVTRAELEHLCEDMFDRVTKPIEDALKASEITLVRHFRQSHLTYR